MPSIGRAHIYIYIYIEVCTKREINENVILVKWKLATWTADVCASPNSRKEESLSQDFAMSVCHVAACVCVCV